MTEAGPPPTQSCNMRWTAVTPLFLVVLSTLACWSDVTFYLRTTMRDPPAADRVSSNHPLSHDEDSFTIRINTWKRPQQLKASIEAYLQCPGVAQIQVVWCLAQGPPPSWLWQYDSVVVVEEHDVNSLNERFRIQIDPPTMAILSVDDDIEIPCLSLDVGFFLWQAHPDRLVGFNARRHVIHSDGHWTYAGMPPVRAEYSITLTRLAFVHKDYLKSYLAGFPLLDRITDETNCEDIALSYWVSAQTGGLPPLLVPEWAIRSQRQRVVDEGISSGADHKALRDLCVEDYAQVLDLKGRLRYAPFPEHDDTYLECVNETTHEAVQRGKPLRQVMLERALCARRKGTETPYDFWYNMARIYQKGLEKVGREAMEEKYRSYRAAVFGNGEI